MSLAVMKCSGCFYGVHHPRRTNPANGDPDLLAPRAHVECHLMPATLKVTPDHWCGQFADRKARELLITAVDTPAEEPTT